MDFHRGWRQRANELSETTKLFLMFGTYILKNHGSRYYGKAMNIIDGWAPPMIKPWRSTTCC